MNADLARIAAYTAAGLLILAPLLIAAATTHITRRRDHHDTELAALERIWRHPAATRRNTRKEPRP